MWIRCLGGAPAEAGGTVPPASAGALGALGNIITAKGI